MVRQQVPLCVPALLSIAVVARAVPSPGCGNPILPPGQEHRLPTNKTVMRNLNMTDKNGLHANRRYAVHIPSSYDYERPQPLPLLLYVHGQSGTAKGDIPPYAAIGEREGFLIASGQGLGADQACSSGWNVGPTNGTCTREAWSPFGANATCCYDTCRRLGRCTDAHKGEDNHCAWSTCFDDVAFLALMLETIEAELCVDTAARFVTGASNGGMMTHYLASQMPKTFAAVLPIYGLPLQGMLNVPAPLAHVSILQFHDRWDTTIPVLGGKSGQGWLYTPLDTTLQEWVAVAGGDRHRPPVRIKTQWDGGDQRLECFEFTHDGGIGDGKVKRAVPRRRRVIKCLFDGFHGSWLPDNHGEEMTWWFMRQHLLP